MSRFNKKINIVLSEEMRIEAQKIVDNNQDKYNNLSHYIRSAIIEKNRKEKVN